MRNIEKREKIIERYGKQDRKLGERKFFEMGELDEKFKKLRDIPPPPEYAWIFKQFLQIWQGCEYDMAGNVIFTFRTVNDYVECMKVPLTVADKKCIFKMKAWAMNTIAEMKDEEKEEN